MNGVARVRAAVAVSYVSLLILLFWSRSLSAWWLGVAAVVLGVATWLERSRRREDRHRYPVVPALALLGLALMGAAATTIRLEHGSRNWEAVGADRERRLSGRLEDRVQGIVRRATAAAGQAAEASADSPFLALARIRERTGVDAVMLLSDDGRPVAWAGDHRGPLPAVLTEHWSGVVFPGGKLLNYLYAVAPRGNGEHAVAAVLLQAGPPLRGPWAAFADRFEAVTGERPRFQPPGDPRADWTFRDAGRPVLQATFPPLSQGEWRGEVARAGRRLVLLLGLIALAFLSVTWLRTLEDRGGPAGLLPMAALAVTLMAAPLRRTLGLERLFSPVFFVLPVPGDFVIEGVLVVLLPLAALLSTLRPMPVRRDELWLRLAIGAALVGGGFAVGARVLAMSAGRPMLTSGGALWYVLQPTSVVLLSMIAVVLMPRSREPDDRRRTAVYGAAGVALSVGLALAVVTAWRPSEAIPTPLLLAWGAPFLLVARAVAGYAGRGDRLIRWLAAGWLASTAVIPHLWLVNQSARLEAAAEEVASFGVRGDPYLSYLLTRYADALSVAAARGEQGSELLYDAWVDSGLEAEPYPVEISLWSGAARRLAHLPLGVRMEEDGPAYAWLIRSVREALEEDETRNVPAEGGGVSRLLVVPVEGRAVTVAVAPRASLRPTSALAAFVGEPYPDAQLELLPSDMGATAVTGQVQWRTTETGWQSETHLREGRDFYHAHLELRLPPPAVRLARGLLLIALDLLLLALLWVLGRATRGDPPVPPGGWLGWLAGFRARLIVSLFAFFLLPTAVFGWAGYRALAGEVTRAAREVAERAVLQASAVLPDAGLQETARRTGEDLLLYRGGVLVESSLPEAVDLGLYSTWMPADLYRTIGDGETLGGTETGELASRSYLVAYRRLRNPQTVIAAPVWLAARDVAVRQREFAHLALFGALVGAVLSLALSVAVGRALSEPISELRRAAGAVGRGRLRVRLPEQRADEFGELFGTFNRMTRRLRRARAQELRTARILAWGEMARQVAHEIKNPLTPIKLSVQHIRRAYRDRRQDFDAILDANVDQILVEIERLTEIAKAFSRYGAPEEATGATADVDVGSVARDVLTLYSAPDRSVHYSLYVRCADCRARSRSSELREVLVNLLENARAAVEEGGRVEVVVDRADGRVTLEVRDDGEGIPADLLDRIFEPHFSTRSSGTGLGLAIVRRLVESWGGEVEAESEPGQGTVVRIRLPADGTPAPDGADAGADPGRGEPR